MSSGGQDSSVIAPLSAEPVVISKTTCRRVTLDELRTGGTILPITRWGTPVMHTRTRPVVRFDRELTELVQNMFATMYAAEGVGLAATQVGVDLAVFVFDCPDDDQVRHVGVICNPEVTLPEGKDRQPGDRRRGLPLAARGLPRAGPARPRHLHRRGP